MKDYIRCPEKIQICACLQDKSFYDVDSPSKCDAVVIKFAILCTDGKYYTLTTNDYDPVITHVWICGSDEINPVLDKIVHSPEELTEYFNTIKPTDAPSIVLQPQVNLMAYWSKVSPKGTIDVMRCTPGSCCSRDKVAIPLPNDKQLVGDGSDHYDGALYTSVAHWIPADAMAVLWEAAQERLKRITEFCLREKAKEDKELEVGASRINELLKFQEKAKSIEEKISSTWNSMTTEDKAKALNLTQNEESVTAAQIVKKRKIQSAKAKSVKKK